MKISTARICLDCDEVFDGATGGFYRTVCPACASKETVLLSKFLPAMGASLFPEEKGG